jgi:HD-like signal output (HDOD) protein/CheY-like chemotaxis protein
VTRLLFVDDEPNILSGLRRQLHGLRAMWDMRFVNGGNEALAELRKTPADVVVTDMRMPSMDGAELLARIRQEWPAVVRIVLSGHAERADVLRSIHEAHQYLAKPCDPALLRSTIDRALRLRSLLQDRNLIELVTRLDHLPSPPALYHDITAAMHDEKVSLRALGSLIERDMALSGKILQVVNSAFFGMPRHVGSPSDAAVMLGIDVLRSLVLGSKLFESASVPAADQSQLESIWLHGQQVAVLARGIAHDLGLVQVGQDRAFLAGLMHEVGKAVLLTGDEATRARSGESYPGIGAYLLGVWGFPDEVVAGVAYHLSRDCDAAPLRDPVAAVHLAACIVHDREPDTQCLQVLGAESIYRRRLAEHRG